MKNFVMNEKNPKINFLCQQLSQKLCQSDCRKPKTPKTKQDSADPRTYLENRSPKPLRRVGEGRRAYLEVPEVLVLAVVRGDEHLEVGAGDHHVGEGAASLRGVGGTGRREGGGGPGGGGEQCVMAQTRPSSRAPLTPAKREKVVYLFVALG